MGSVRVWLFGALVGGIVAVPLVLYWPEDVPPPSALAAAPAPGPRPPRRSPRAQKVAPEKTGAIDDDAPAEDPQPMVVPSEGLEQLGRLELEAGMAKVRSRVLACRDVERFDGTLLVHLTIARSGSVQGVSVLPPADQTATATCVRTAVKSASFPRFRGTYLPTIELTYPFQMKE
jgi:hypothetical protein